MLTANCPLDTKLTAVPETTCPFDFGQIAKIAFQQRQSAKSFTAITIKSLATWTPLLAASDVTKVVMSPIVNNPVIPKSEILKEGGNDNTTLKGMPQINGLGHVEMTAIIKSISDATKQALQALFPFSQIMPGLTNLYAFFITSDNKIIAGADGVGIYVYGVAISDPGSDGFAKKNECTFQLSLPGGWSDNIIVVPATDFTFLTLKNPT